MPGFKESSILFSLQGLLDREKERQDEEHNDQLRAIEHANQVRLEREHRQREEEERQVREAHARALREEAERREHQARLEAVKRAEIERVRLEAESRSRLETVAMQQEHERRMAAIELESRVRRFRAFAVGGVLFGAATLVAALALYLGKLEPEQARMEAAYSQLVSAQRARAEGAEKVADRQKAKNVQLSDELDVVKHKLADARREIEKLKAARDPRGGGPRLVPGAPPKAGTPPCTGDPDDPMNGCLK